MSRRAGSSTVSLILTAVLGGVAPRAGGPPQTTPAANQPALVLQSEMARDIETDQTHAFLLRAFAGDFVRLNVEQEGIDVAVSIFEPGGHLARDVNTCHGDVCTERLITVLGATGDYVVRVRSTEGAQRRGRYTIRLDEQHAPAASDRVLVEAARTFEHATAVLDRNLPAGYEESLREYAAALTQFRTVNDRRGELEALVHMAGLTGALGRGTEAISLSQDAERLAREIDSGPSLAMAQRHEGDARERLGDLAGALQAYEAGAATARAIRDRRLEGIIVNAQAIVYGRSGDSERGIERSEYALTLAKANGFLGLIPILWNNLGIAYKDLGQFQKSLEAYTEALETLRKGTDADLRVVILNNMGNLERLLGRPREALRLHEQSLALAQETGGRDNEARALNTIGLTYYALGEHAKALDYHQRALAIRLQTNDLPGQAASLNGEAKALHRLGDSERAIDILEQALALRRRIRERFGELDSLKDLAVVERDRGNLAAAVGHIRSAVDLEEAIRARITSPEVRATFRAAEEDKYELFIDLLQQLHRVEPDRGHDLEALTISERARARVLLESLLDARVDLREGIDPALLARERTLQKQISDASAQLSRALARSGVDGNGTLAKRFDDLNDQYASTQSEIRRRSPRYAAMTQAQPAAASDIVDSVVDADTVLLEFALGEERSWLFAVSRNGVASVELQPRRVLEQAARLVYDRLTARQPRRGEGPRGFEQRVAAADAALPQAAQAMSDLLFGGIASRLRGEWQAKRLAIVASGSLEYLPFAALPLPSASNAPRPRNATRLSERHEIVTIPSASVLLAMRQETAGRQPARGSVAVFADPVFDAADPRVTVKPSASVPNALNRLAFSREEGASIAAIAKAAGSNDVLHVTDFAANRTAVLDPQVANYRIVHIATHGIVDAERPAQTALIFSLLDERGATRDGYVRMRDIYNLRLGADLVVLSACQTALGTSFKGEGLVGLARGFMYAGAPRVVASLWQVSDVATAELMKRFYRLMLQDGQRPAAALRSAQREMSKDPRWGSPYYWAGFVMQGDWR